MRTTQPRILLVDDNRSIHEDYRKILIGAPQDTALLEVEARLFDQTPAPVTTSFDLTSAYQGEEALQLVQAAVAAGRPFSVAFIDVRMPPGIDGVTTAARLWQIDPDLQVVICTAYADHSWSTMRDQLQHPDQWVILRKPFDNVEVLQLSHSLTAKWALLQADKARFAMLEERVRARTSELERALLELRSETAAHAKAEEERRGLEKKFEETQRLESLGVLAGGIAHDFNNILTGILGSASLAKLECAVNTPLDEHLNRIEKSACRAAELCEQMLAYAGKGQVSLQRLDANAVVKQTIELLHASVPKDAKLTVELAPNLPPVLADQARLHQVVMNLVINAAEALTSHPRMVRLATRSYILDQETIGRMTFPGEAKPGEFICIEVSDTGTGMSAEVIRRIFEPFYTTKFTGRGLGLSAVQGIIRARGGALHVDSQLGQGSTFRAFFPVCAENVGAAGPLNPVGRHNSIRKLTLLLVDDENSVLEVAAHALRRQGHTVYTASNGAHAVTLIQGLSQSVDGVLLDLTMPELDGVSTLHALRALRPNLRFVLMSGYDQQEATRRFDGLGLSGFLQKPFDIQSLREKVNLMANAELV